MTSEFEELMTSCRCLIVEPSSLKSSLNIFALLAFSGILMATLQMLSGLSVIITCWVLCIYHRPTSRPIPPWVKVFMRLMVHQNSKDNKVTPKTEEAEETEVTWRDVANHLDGILFILFMITIVFVVIICVIRMSMK